jgi:hypothetical protein
LELLKYVPFIKDEAVKIKRYLSGLPPSIGDRIQYDDPKTMEETIRRGKKPPFFKKSPQGQPSFKEPKKAEVGEKMPIPPPMECWGCKGNHRYRDCPHKKDKARTVHNI